MGLLSCSRFLPNPPFLISPVNFSIFYISALVHLMVSQPDRHGKVRVFEARKPESESQLHHLLAVGSWASNTNFLCFGFFICMVGNVLLVVLYIYAWSALCNTCVCMQCMMACIKQKDLCQSIL